MTSAAVAAKTVLNMRPSFRAEHCTRLGVRAKISGNANEAVAILLRFRSYGAMITRYKKLLLTLGALVLLGATAILSQTRQSAPDGPRLYRIWSDDRGETHLEEINIATKGRPTIPGITLNFPGVVTGPVGPGRGAQLHNTGARQFAITVFGQIDVEASDGTRAHLRTGDMSFIEDVTGKGHRTFEEGSQSVFLRVPENFDVKKWAAGN